MTLPYVSETHLTHLTPEARIRAVLDAIPSGSALSASERASLAERIAYDLVAMADGLSEPSDRSRARMLSRLMRDPYGQALTTALTDRLYRSASAARIVDEVAHLISRFGLPQYMQPLERAGLWGVRPLSRVAPKLLAKAIADRVRSETRAVLLPADSSSLGKHVAARHREAVRINVNQLGEALLGEEDAEARVKKYAALAAQGQVDAISVKVSSIGSQLNLLSFEATVETLATRLKRIYAATLEVAPDKRPIVMLDMEAYQDIELTFCVMERALGDQSLDQVRAGIVLQAYLPDSNAWQERLLAWAQKRRARGAHPLRMRLVKGANLAQERVDSEKLGMSVPIYEDKRDVDANYKRMLERATRPEHLSAVALGIASHNLFDIAYGLVLRAERNAKQTVGFELLEGMADPVRRALCLLQVDVLVYAPICADDQMNSGIAYLVRRLDENTASDNFLRSSFGMRPGDASFEHERLRFREACARLESASTTPRRSHDANYDRRVRHVRARSAGSFQNEADTDFSVRHNRDWIRAELEQAKSAATVTLRSQIAGAWAESDNLVDGFDPSRPSVTPYRLALASAQDVARALACAADDVDAFSNTTSAERAQLLTRVAQGLRQARGALIAAMLLDSGKRVIEADAELSEAIDFAEYYRASYLAIERAREVSLTARGSVLVTPPWNFPLAIPAGGVLAALMAGNRVILKPALETAFVAERLCRVLWDAGVPRTALQLVICEDEVASALVQDARIQSVILTGATDTARLFQRLRPGLRLHAETGGKNAIIVTAMSDRDLAIRDAVHSAFGHAGQKCSAASLLILEAEVYDDAAFMETLRDAVESLPVGPGWDARSFVTPLIHPPSGALKRALDTLDEGESWLVEPHVDANNPRLVSPGVKLGVKAGSFTHKTELFGPLLAVMRAENLDHAIELAAATGYGLTAGLASLDEREQARFIEQMPAGNLYVNRTITGAVVDRQPFGGLGKSGFGPGAKAGGPNYVAQLCHVRDHELALRPTVSLDAEVEARVNALRPMLNDAVHAELVRRVTSYAHAASVHFRREHKAASVRGQDNIFRYRPCPGIALRVAADASVLDVASSCLAAEIAGTRIQLSVSPGFKGPKDASFWGHPLAEESAQALATRHQLSRIRVVGSREPALDNVSTQTGAHIEDAQVLGIGRYELLHYLREQSLSIEFHRYGNLGIRGQIAEAKLRNGNNASHGHQGAKV